ncbi:MAG: GTP-binding protein, partial [Planctomycetota bacterium]
PKAWVGSIAKGQIDLALLDRISNRETSAPRAGHAHGTGHHTESEEPAVSEECSATSPMVRRRHDSPAASTLGWICWTELVFDEDLLFRWLNELSRRSDTQRTKAVFRTTEGWLSFNFSGGVAEVKPSGYRRDSRLEIVFDGALPADTEDFESRLQGCLSSTPE